MAGTLSKFASEPIFTNNRRLISDLNIQLLEAVQEKREADQPNFIEQLMTPPQTGEKAVDIIDDKLIVAIRDSRNGDHEIEMLAKIWHQLGRAVLQHDYKWKPEANPYGIDRPLRDWACFEKPEDSQPNGNIWYDPNTWQFFSSPSAVRIRYCPKRLYDYIQPHHAIVDWFNKKGFRTSIVPYANELEERYAFHPLVLQRLLQGRLGEEAIRALLHDRGVTTSTALNNPRVLELYDFSIANTNFRVDAKFWSQRSTDQADLEYQKWLSEGAEVDTAPLGLPQKISQIKELEGADTKLAILNFVPNREDAILLGFDCNLQRTSVAHADILILGGCITENLPTNYTPGFEEFINLVSAAQL